MNSTDLGAQHFFFLSIPRDSHQKPCPTNRCETNSEMFFCPADHVLSTSLVQKTWLRERERARRQDESIGLRLFCVALCFLPPKTSRILRSYPVPTLGAGRGKLSRRVFQVGKVSGSNRGGGAEAAGNRCSEGNSKNKKDKEKSDKLRSQRLPLISFELHHQCQSYKK